MNQITVISVLLIITHHQQVVHGLENTCYMEKSDCNYKIVIQQTDCATANDQPMPRSNSVVEKIEKDQSGDEVAKVLKRMLVVEKSLMKMIEGLASRSLRHMRHIRSDLAHLSETVENLASEGTGRPVVSGLRGRRGKDGVECPPEFLGGGSWPHCYRLATFNASWNEAKEYCSAIGADLLSLETVKEAYIVDYLLKSNRAYSEAESWWTSANYIVRSHRWMWTSMRYLRPLDFTRWAPGEPNGRSTMHCLVLHRPDAYKWRDAQCSDRHSFICEVDLL